MSLSTPAYHFARLAALQSLHGQLVAAAASMGIVPHYSSPFGTDGATLTLIATADASSLATSKTLAKALADALTAHGVNVDAHRASSTIACAAFASSPAVPADLTEVQAVLNEVKADFNTHIADATVHRGVSGQGKASIPLITTTDAIDQATANALANAIKAALNAHARAGVQDLSVTVG